jgi:tetratricopeptide (TPR) repeat protein
MLPAMRGRLLASALAACLGVAAVALDAPPARAEEVSAVNQAAAKRHFEKGRAYYAQGAYREAIGELEAAHALDPTSKHLVFNLGVVHEKLGDIDDALKYFKLYTTMELTQQERDRADAYVKRLEGAKHEVEQSQSAQTASATTSVPPSPPTVPTAHERPPLGRIDALTISFAGIAVAGLAFGIVFAAKAEHDKPPSPFITGKNGTYADLVDRQANAHREAVLADIGFGVAGATAAAAAVLFFARPRTGASSTTTTGTTSVSAAPLTGGGALFVQGSF